MPTNIQWVIRNLAGHFRMWKAPDTTVDSPVITSFICCRMVKWFPSLKSEESLNVARRLNNWSIKVTAACLQGLIYEAEEMMARVRLLGSLQVMEICMNKSKKGNYAGSFGILERRPHSAETKSWKNLWCALSRLKTFWSFLAFLISILFSLSSSSPGYSRSFSMKNYPSFCKKKRLKLNKLFNDSD